MQIHIRRLQSAAKRHYNQISRFPAVADAVDPPLFWSARDIPAFGQHQIVVTTNL